MPLAPAVIAAIIGGGASIAGGALANRGTQSTAPTMDPAYSGLQNQILQLVTNRLGSSPDLSGYEGSGISTINSGFDSAKTGLDNDLAARGLSTSPVAGSAAATLQRGRAGAVTQFRNSVPLLARQLQTQDLGVASGVLGLGRGETSTASGGGGAAGAFTNLAGYLGYLQGLGKFGAKAPLGATQTASPLGFLAPGGGY